MESTVRKGEELKQIEAMIGDIGSYPYRTTQSELEELRANEAKLLQLFEAKIKARLESWLTLAEERLRNTGIRLYLTGGNDDPLEIEEIIKRFESDYIIDPEGDVVDIDGKHEMISCGYSNITPWKCPRDIPEEKLADKIHSMISRVKDVNNALFNLHCPPYNSGLDLASELDEALKPKIDPASGGGEVYTPGKQSCAWSVERYQPIATLHGHIHESRGFRKIGRTLCFNPGSEYGEGILRGVLLIFRNHKLDSFLLTEE